MSDLGPLAAASRVPLPLPAMSGRCAWLWFATGPDGRVRLHPRRRCFYISVSIFFFLLHASSLAFVFAALSPKLFNFFPLRLAGPLPFKTSCSFVPPLRLPCPRFCLLSPSFTSCPREYVYCRRLALPSLSSCAALGSCCLGHASYSFCCSLGVLPPSVTPPGLALLGILVKHIAGDVAVRFFPPLHLVYVAPCCCGLLACAVRVAEPCWTA